ncbi:MULTISPECIES: TetR/AcrR family transcriptional regulator [Streptomyces]|uniref:TetR/AcrR family transcriptional regulator n=1 Tax=Streptomyces TaxID=1883 RepID=UPI00131972FD|nr:MULTISPECIES: TetR/AcrR family transcriptional regulator [Streptomyces]QGZ47740.1 TetR family transcriptional regulator [Streptomyces sp. QHH-9511]GGT94131.1 TetR family transcriptional regulator [Streptomyces lateritius]
MPPKQQRGEVTVDRLLTAALQVYAESGRQGFTVNAVTAASGVSLGSLYHHFGSFDGLAAGLYIRCMGQLCDEVFADLGRTRTPRTGVRALVKGYLRFTVEHRDAALFLHASAYSGYLTAHAEEIRAFKAVKFASIAEWLRPHIEAGVIAPLPTPVLEVLVMGPIEETARRWLSSTYDIDLNQAARILPDRIWRSLRPD